MNDPKITLTELTVADCNLIMAGLGKLPLEAVIELWSKLKSQAETQLSESSSK